MRFSGRLPILLTFTATIRGLTLPQRLISIAESSTALAKRQADESSANEQLSQRGASIGGDSDNASEYASTIPTPHSATPLPLNTNGPAASIEGKPLEFPDGSTFYYGGAKQPYKAGAVSPSGILPLQLVVDGPKLYPGSWPDGAWWYEFPRPYSYHNATSGRNETKPADCICAENRRCGCELVAGNETYYNTYVANEGRMSKVVVKVEGIETLVLNGTLPNGTTASKAPSLKRGGAGRIGWSVAVAGIVYTIWLFEERES